LNKNIYIYNKKGFVPNIFLILCRRPNEFRSFFQYYDALMKDNNSELTMFEKESIVVATSNENKCLYCVVAHGAMLRVYAKKQDIGHYNLLSVQIATDYKKANISDKHKLMLDYAIKLCNEPYNINQN